MKKFVFVLMFVSFAIINLIYNFETCWEYFSGNKYDNSQIEAIGREIRAEDAARGVTYVNPRDYLASQGQSSTSSAPAHTHNYERTVTKEATCSEEGVVTYTCSGCGNSYTESIPKTDHTWTETVINPATCSTEGEVKKVCSVCGEEVIEKTPIDPEVHDYEEVIVKEATCTIDGIAKKVCKGCGAETEEYVIPATGHEYESRVTTEPTCTEVGVTTYTCKKCGDTYTEDIPALGHDEVSEYVYKVKIGNLVFDGKTVYTCNRCGEVREEADPNTYSITLLYSVAAIIAVLLGFVIMLLLSKSKKHIVL